MQGRTTLLHQQEQDSESCPTPQFSEIAISNWVVPETEPNVITGKKDNIVREVGVCPEEMPIRLEDFALSTIAY